MKRVFIAIDIKISIELEELIRSYKTRLADEKIRWVSPGNIHLTLAFLGDLDKVQIGQTASLLEEVVAEYPKFPVGFGETGVFRSINHPRVIWLGVKTPDVLYEMRESVCNKLRQENLYRDEKKFSPHITLGRMKYIINRDMFSGILNSGSNINIPEQLISEIILFESILKPEGPVYVPVVKALLKES